MLQKLYTSLQEILRFEGVKDEIDPKLDTFCDVVGSYYLVEEIRCSKKDCHQKHKSGAIVKLGSGALSYIGNRCAKGIFGENYERAWESHREAIVLPQLRRELVAFKHSLEGITKRAAVIDGQLPKYTELRQKLSQFFPEVNRYVVALYHSGKNKVVYEKEREKQQIDRLRAMNPTVPIERWKFEEVTVGYLAGLAVFEGFNPSTILRADLLPGIESIAEANPYTLPKKDVFALHRWGLEVEYKLSRLEKWVGSAEAFFTDENLGILKALSSNGRLKPEIDRLSLTELNRLELRAANEQFKSARQEKKISESQPDGSKENGRIAVGMRAYRRLTGGQ